MIYRDLAGTGVKLPVIGQGTWNMGVAQAQEAEEIRALRLGIELGLSHIDTAEMYGDGSTEIMVGRALSGLRQRVFLTSKVLPSNASYAGTLKACEQSLKRLGTDYLDLYLLHWWSGRHPIAETMRAMEKLVRSGKTRFIGVSNFDTVQLGKAQGALSSQRLVCNQVCYHLRSRSIEFSLLPYCEGQGMAVVGYSPFGSGNFVTPNSEGWKTLAEIGASHGKSVRQVALQFLIRRASLFAIPKASGIEHVHENSGAAEGELTAEDLAAISRVFPPPTKESPLEIS
jgi:diketogulonate reductase-like aldo/keto reductase